MKELSIEEKAARYDEAIKKAIVAEKYKDIDSHPRATLYKIFPELIAGEEIKGAIIHFISNTPTVPKGIIGKKTMIAWLEEQDSYTFEIKEGHWYKCVCDYMLNGSDLMFKNDKLYYCRRDWRLTGEIDERNVKDIGVNGYKSFFRPATNQEIKDWLEQQGEQKSIWHNEYEEPQKGILILLIMQNGTPIVAKIIEPNHTFNHGEKWAYIDDLLEKEDDQKIVDYDDANIQQDDFASKVEHPKFKFGDWIVWNNKNYKVNYNGCGYELIDQDGLSTSLDYETVDESAHLWSVPKDAKYGDLLFLDLMGGKTFIYNGINTDTAILYSFIISNDGEDVLPYHIGKPNTGIGYIEENKNIIYPATKEQCDALFVKMKEKGYELDSEKKELKKIHNALEDCEIENIKHGKYYYCIKDYYSGGNKRASKGDVVLALRGMSMMALGAKANEYFIPVNAIKQEKSNWGVEDDKKHIDSLLKRLTGLCKNEFERTRFAISEDQDWLESLKDRIQPKQE